MKKNYKVIFVDGFILVSISTVFVLILNFAFKSIKKGVDLDPIVTAINQDAKEDALDIFNKPDVETDRANRRDEFKRTPLMMASYANYESVETLNKTDDKRVPWVELLVKNGAALNVQDQEGWTPLMWASWSGLTKVVEKLIELGASVHEIDKKGNTALMLAAARANGAITHILMKNGADKTLVNQKGQKAIDLAEKGRKEYKDRAHGYQEVLSSLNG